MSLHSRASHDTGDIAWRDDSGNFYVVDRMKELIKTKGFQVAPAELEGLLLQHPDIADSAVIGVPDERSGELPIAFVVKKAGERSVDEAAIKAWLKPKVAEYKLPAAIIFIDSVPKSTSGKILRRELKANLETLLAGRKL